MPDDHRSRREHLALIEQRDGEQGWYCVWCQTRMVRKSRQQYCSPQKRTIEHLIPRSEQGPCEVENEVTACFDCNSRRGCTPIGDWLEDADNPDIERIMRQLIQLRSCSDLPHLISRIDEELDACHRFYLTPIQAPKPTVRRILKRPQYQRERCTWCRRRNKRNVIQWQVDFLITEADPVLENAVLACPSCVRSHRKLTTEVWAQRVVLPEFDIILHLLDGLLERSNIHGDLQADIVSFQQTVLERYSAYTQRVQAATS